MEDIHKSTAYKYFLVFTQLLSDTHASEHTPTEHPKQILSLRTLSASHVVVPEIFTGHLSRVLCSITSKPYCQLNAISILQMRTPKPRSSQHWLHCE